MWSFDIHHEAGTYTWRLWASDGHIAAAPPEPFQSRYAAHRAAERLAETGLDLKVTTFVDPESGHHRWRLDHPQTNDALAVGYERYKTADEAQSAGESARHQTSMAGVM